MMQEKKQKINRWYFGVKKWILFFFKKVSPTFNIPAVLMTTKKQIRESGFIWPDIIVNFTLIFM